MDHVPVSFEPLGTSISAPSAEKNNVNMRLKPYPICNPAPAPFCASACSTDKAFPLSRKPKLQPLVVEDCPETNVVDVAVRRMAKAMPLRHCRDAIDIRTLSISGMTPKAEVVEAVGGP